MKAFIGYLDDNDKKIEAWVNIIDIKDSYITFKTHGDNVILLPTWRILKIKVKNKEYWRF